MARPPTDRGGIASTVAIVLRYGECLVELAKRARLRVVSFITLNDPAVDRARHDKGRIRQAISDNFINLGIGLGAAMLLLAMLTWIMLLAMGVGSPLLLGIQAGLFNFVPYLGAVVGAVPILLMALPFGTTTWLITLGLYTVIHVGVGYVFMPLVQKQAVDLPPAITLASLILFGVLFGVASVAVATPIVAVIRHAVLRLQQFSPNAAIDEFVAG
jgi:predicted PurR-regulated permease PerM